jgi:hypothetical protein
VAIVQVSRITNRKGLAENLPQLAGAELGWAIDDRKLYIGNGTLAEGAPEIGNTEILTEYSPVPLPTTVTLTDNTPSATTAFSLSANTAVIAYTIIRDTALSAGTILVAASGAGVAFNATAQTVGTTGIVLSAIYADGLIQIQYTSTSTGDDAQLTYVVTISN